MSDENQQKVIAYRLSPIFDRQGEGAWGSAAVMTCWATGECLSGMGGGGMFLSPKIVGALKNNGARKGIVEGDVLTHMEHARVSMEALQAIARGDQPSGDVQAFARQKLTDIGRGWELAEPSETA